MSWVHLRVEKGSIARDLHQLNLSYAKLKWRFPCRTGTLNHLSGCQYVTHQFLVRHARAILVEKLQIVYKFVLVASHNPSRKYCDASCASFGTCPHVP